jgi:nucleoside-diphosphate-sugar epimerase
MYGLPEDGRLSPSTPIAPRSKKGELRARAAEEMLSAKTPVAIARASDFFGPRIHNAILGERFWKKLFANKAVEVMGDPDQPHTLSYGPDVADGLVTLGLADESAFGRVWHLPALPAEPIRVWIERFAKEVGRQPKMMKLSPLLLHIAGVFIPEAGELPEMMYQWRSPFILDDSDFRARFNASPTPLERTIAETLAWAKQMYLPASREAA